MLLLLLSLLSNGQRTAGRGGVPEEVVARLPGVEVQGGGDLGEGGAQPPRQHVLHGFLPGEVTSCLQLGAQNGRRGRQRLQEQCCMVVMVAGGGAVQLTVEPGPEDVQVRGGPVGQPARDQPHTL